MLVVDCSLFTTACEGNQTERALAEALAFDAAVAEAKEVAGDKALIVAVGFEEAGAGACAQALPASQKVPSIQHKTPGLDLCVAKRKPGKCRMLITRLSPRRPDHDLTCRWLSVTWALHLHAYLGSRRRCRVARGGDAQSGRSGPSCGRRR